MDRVTPLLRPSQGRNAKATPRRTRRGFGRIEEKRKPTRGQLGAYRASYVGPDHGTHTPGQQFGTREAAEGWLRDEQRLIDRGDWIPPADRRKAAEVSALTFGEYSEEWISSRLVNGRPLKARTAEHYRDIRARWFAALLERPLSSITPAEVDAWFRALPDAPTMRQHAYALLRSVYRSAVAAQLVATNPVVLERVNARPKPAEVELLTAADVGRLADAMPDRHRLAVLLAAWCGLRFGEVAALRRRDFDLDEGVLRVERAIVTVAGQRVETTPKSDAGTRRVVIPPHLVPDVKAHLRDHAQWGRDGLLFPSTTDDQPFVTPSMVYGNAPTFRKDGTPRKAGSGYYLARHTLGRPDLPFHKLRHFAATTYAIAGATDRELMAMMGHSSHQVAMRYQHAAKGRAESLAARMSQLAHVEQGVES